MDLCVLGAHWRTLWHRYNDHCQSTTSVICLCILRSDCHNTASSNSQPSCTHSAPLTECPDENALPLHDSPCQDFWKELEVSVGSVCSITCNSPVSGRTQANAELLYCMQETCGCPESFHRATTNLAVGRVCLKPSSCKTDLWTYKYPFLHFCSAYVWPRSRNLTLVFHGS